MIKARVGGFAAFIVMCKTINMISNCVGKVCAAKKWKNYYKYGKDGNMVPPDYEMHTHEGTNGDYSIDTASAESMKKQKTSESRKDSGTIIAESIAKAVDAYLNKDKSSKEQSEKDICPKDCMNCTNKEDCPYENLRYNGVITEWSSDGEPIAGRYSWNNDGEYLVWQITEKAEEYTDTESDDSLYTDSLENGVEVVSKEEDEDVQELYNSIESHLEKGVEVVSKEEDEEEEK